MQTAVAHYYRSFRRQNPNRTAVDCFASAKSFVHFRQRLSASVKQDKKRTKAAKKGWKTRRAKAH